MTKRMSRGCADLHPNYASYAVPRLDCSHPDGYPYAIYGDSDTGADNRNSSWAIGSGVTMGIGTAGG